MMGTDAGRALFHGEETVSTSDAEIRHRDFPRT
jgi:hypothetical protein